MLDATPTRFLLSGPPLFAAVLLLSRREDAAASPTSAFLPEPKLVVVTVVKSPRNRLGGVLYAKGSRGRSGKTFPRVPVFFSSSLFLLRSSLFASSTMNAHRAKAKKARAVAVVGVAFIIIIVVVVASSMLPCFKKAWPWRERKKESLCVYF